jgi:ribosomal protein L24E
VSDQCTWCGTEVEDGYRVYEPAGDRRAVFCRLEHVVPWAIRGASWEPGTRIDDAPLQSCSFCGAELTDAHVLVLRSRGEHVVPDGFCNVEHLLEWAKSGGRYQ